MSKLIFPVTISLMVVQFRFKTRAVNISDVGWPVNSTNKERGVRHLNMCTQIPSIQFKI